MALAPFAFGAVASAGIVWFVHRARRRRPTQELSEVQHRRAWVARIIVAVCVFAGALAIPLGLEIMWRYDGVAGSHQQPEVTTVEVGGQDLVKGRDPYLPIRNVHHEVAYHAPGEPDTPGFLPYLPLMAVLGHPERHLAQQRAQ